VSLYTTKAQQNHDIELQWLLQWYCNTIAIGKTYNELFCWYFIRLLARINKCATKTQQMRYFVAMVVAMVLQWENFLYWFCWQYYFNYKLFCKAL
jgi:hypothetical protein